MSRPGPPRPVALVGLGANAALRAFVVLVALPALGVLADVLCATYMAPLHAAGSDNYFATS